MIESDWRRHFGRRKERTTVAVLANVTMPQIPKRGRRFSAIVDCKGFGFLRNDDPSRS